MKKEEIYKQVFSRNCDFNQMTIQDCIYAYQIALMLLNDLKKLLPDFYKEIGIYLNCIYNQIVNKLIKLNTVYTIKPVQTEVPYMEFLKESNEEICRLWLFSDIAFAKKCAKYYQKADLSFAIEKIDNQNFIRFLKDMIYLGFNSILLDNGLLYIELSFNDLINIKDEHITVINSDFIRKYLDFVQSYHKKIYPLKVMKEKEQNLLKSISKANFLIPMKTIQKTKDEGVIIEYPQLTTLDKEVKLQPIFTDWREFRKWDKNYEYDGTLLDFEGLYKFYNQSKELYSYISINPFSLNYKLNKERFLIIKERK